MDRINQNKIQSTIFNRQRSNVKGVKTMENNIKKIVNDLLKRAEREVPEYGEFAIVHEEFPNLDKNINASDFMLKITKPPKTVEGNETWRYLEAVVYNLPSPYKASRVIAAGSTSEILKALKDEGLSDKLKSEFLSLANQLEDI